MKKLLPYTFIILFPYAVGFLISSIFQPVLMEHIFHNNIYLGVLYLFGLWLIAFISAVIICIWNMVNKKNAVESARMNMIIKLVQIPAYLFIFATGLVCMITIFTMGISFVLMLLDCASILLSGLVGVSAVKRNHDVGILSGNEMILHGILQFIFFADIISSIMVFRKSKAKLSWLKLIN